jgi:FXSXX-COOH protein
MQNTAPDLESMLADVTALSLAELKSLGGLDDSVLGRSLRRLLEEADDPAEVVAGFQSST